jgi:quercetin dioxygenase-like cupin family protein
MKATRRTARMGAFALGLVLAAACPGFAAQPPAEAFPPVEHATFHQLVFADEDLAILNNLYPPKGDSGFHTHYRDLFAVVVQASPSSRQSLGKPMSAAPITPAGASLYSAVGDEPRTHRVVNDGDTSTLQIIVIELRRAKPSGRGTSSRDEVPQYVQVFDNPRMRAWRLILQPGQSVPAISQADKGVRVVVRGGLLTTTMPGVQDQQLALRPGDFTVQQAGATRALRNDGTDTIELVELELK